jgi:uncharacterized membrane protein YqaE (UPF0057 family)
MKRIKHLMLLAVVVFIASCTVEKRRYTDGYHVEWRQKHEKPGMNKSSDPVAVERSFATQSSSEKTMVETAPSVAPNLNPVVATAENNVTVQNEKIDRKAARKLKQDLREEITSSDGSESLAAHEEIQKISQDGKIEYQDTPTSIEAQSTPEKGVLILLAILIPPLAVYLYEGSWTKRCTINLILTCLCGIPGMIHALVVILE